MRDDIFLVCDHKGIQRMTKRFPSLRGYEIGVHLRITIPDGAFKAPIITATVEVPEQATLQPAATVDIVDPPPAEPVTFQTRSSHETYIDAEGCHCRHCGLRWGVGEPEPPGPCVWPRITDAT